MPKKPIFNTIQETEIIYPKNLYKYIGSISKIKYDKYRYYYKNENNGILIDKRFNNYEEAIEMKKETSYKLNMIKNIIHIIYENGEKKYLMDLTQGKQTIIDEESIPIVDKYIWHAADNGYSFLVKTSINGKSVYLHQILLNFTSENDTVPYYINGDTLDNRLKNLIIIPKSTKSIVSVHNIHKEHKGVYHQIKHNRYVGKYNENGITKSKSFSCLKYGKEKAKRLAEEFRKKGTENIYSYQLANSL